MTTTSASASSGFPPILASGLLDPARAAIERASNGAAAVAEAAAPGALLGRRFLAARERRFVYSFVDFGFVRVAGRVHWGLWCWPSWFAAGIGGLGAGLGNNGASVSR